MCGITGIFAFNEKGRAFFNNTNDALAKLNCRGPDSKGMFSHINISLAHSRLSIIDTSNAASQPFHDDSGRYTIIFNGEIFNFNEIREHLSQKGISFKSHSDTEVVLYSYILYGPDFLNKLNGFFAFAIYDKISESIFIARDRMGIKPLIYYIDDDKFIFSSEMKALLSYGIPKELDYVSLYSYLQLNYIPAPETIFKNVKKLTPGTYLIIKDKNIVQSTYYKIPYIENIPETNYEAAKQNLIQILDESVKMRLISDVPLGAFLSGGIDSSIIVSLASKYTNKLNTFSIGFKDEPMFDETYYAGLVAKKYNTNHTAFSLSTEDMFGVLFDVLDYIDEPYADSSAIAVYILSQHTRKYVTVALSGDGADELFAGYNKHFAEYKIRTGNQFAFNILKSAFPLLKALPQSRNSFLGNKFRQISRFSEGAKLQPDDRYWRWCSYVNEDNALMILNKDFNKDDYYKRKKIITGNIKGNKSMNDVLHTDMHLVLQNDMLMKVDLMSMANSLEVRVPFLDYNLVNYVFNLPSEFKIDNNGRKKILKEAFRNNLPDELFRRGKHGFEVPLLKWFRTGLKTLIMDNLLEDKFIEAQGIFNPVEIKKLKQKLFSNNPGEIHARIWGLIVFQYWWKKYMQ